MNYILNITLKTQILLFLAIIFLIYIVHILIYFFKVLKSFAKPIMFPYKHVLITGCGTGLGEDLVQEIYMRGAYITMFCRDE